MEIIEILRVFPTQRGLRALQIVIEQEWPAHWRTYRDHAGVNQLIHKQ